MVRRATAYEALSLAIRKNSVSATKNILRQHGALIKDEQWLDYILLIKALQRGRRRIAKLLLKRGCRVHRPDKTNFFHTPLYYAVRLEDSGLVEALLNKGASINGRDFNKETPLCLALRKKYRTILDVMLSKYLYQISNLTSLDNDDYLAFTAACMINDKNLVECFIKHGICINENPSADESNSSPLHVAVRHQNLEVTELLLQHGADVNAKNAKTGQTALHVAFYMRKRCYPSKNCWKIIDAVLTVMKRTDANPVDDTGLSHFHIACTRNKPDIVEHFLRCGVDINSPVNFDSPTCSGYTPLHFAIENKHRSIIQLLLSHGVDATLKNKDGHTPFHFAFSFFYSDNAVIDLILSKHIPKTVNPVNNAGLTHFHISSCTDNVDAIKEFLENGASVDDAVSIDSSKCPGYTPLHFAVTFNRRAAVETLLEHRVDANSREKDGLTPLHLACQQNAKKIHTILRKSVEAASSSTCDKMDMESIFKESASEALDSIAKQNEQVDIVDLLLQHKCNVNAHDDLRKTPLFHACDIDHETFECEFGSHLTQMLSDIISQFQIKRRKIVEILLKHKANVNVYDSNKQTVLHYLADTNRILGDNKKAEIAELLLNEGADVNARTETGLTPLHIALKRGFKDLVDVFLKYDVDPNITEYENRSSPLHLATLNNHLAPKSEEMIIRALLQKGADVDLKQIDGKTPLHIAASTRYLTNKLTPLLEMECDVDCQDSKGKTPLHMACLNRNADNVQNLLNIGADMNIMDLDGNTAFFYFYEFQVNVLESRRYIYDFHQIYYIFKNHIKRLITIGFYVSWDNMSYYKKLQDIHKQLVANNYEDDIVKRCEDEVKKMKNIKINTYSSLYSILFKDPNEMAMYAKNENLQTILQSSSFKGDFAQYNFLLALQFKKGVTRSKLLKPAKESFECVVGLSLPDSCSERIFRYLSNKNLKDLIKAQTLTYQNGDK